MRFDEQAVAGEQGEGAALTAPRAPIVARRDWYSVTAFHVTGPLSLSDHE